MIHWADLGPTAFADEISVARPVMSHILSARNKASLEVVQKIIQRFPEVSPGWLITGEGEMLIDNSSRPLASAKRQGNQISIQSGKNEAGAEGKANLSDAADENPELGKEPKKTLVTVMLLYSDGSFDSYSPSPG